MEHRNAAVEEASYVGERLGRWREKTNGPFFIFAAAVIPILILEFAWDDLPDNERVVLYGLNVLISLVFIVDYFVEMWLSTDRWGYVKGEWVLGVVVLSSVFVLFPVVTLSGGLRLLALLRFARALVGVVRVVSVGATMFSGGRAAIRRKVTSTVFEAALFVWVTSAAAFALAEGVGPEGKSESFTDALWWALMAMFPGAGPKVPAETLVGRCIYLFCIGTGLVVFSVLVARVAAIFTDGESDPEDEVGE